MQKKKRRRLILFIDFPVQAQSSRVVIQPGFVTYQGENSFTLPWFSAWEDRTPGWIATLEDWDLTSPT